MPKVDLTQLAARQDVLRMLERHGALINEAATALRDGKLDADEALSLHRRIADMRQWELDVLIPSLTAIYTKGR